MKGYSYGVTIPTNDGLICIGGEWGVYNNNILQKNISNKVFMIKHLGNGRLEIDDMIFPEIPEPIYAMGGAKIGNNIFVVGGDNGINETKNFWKLDLLKKDKWEVLIPWEGSPRSHLLVAAQSDGERDCLYIFSGRFNDPQRGWQFLSDGFKYDPIHNSWTTISDVGTNLSNNNAYKTHPNIEKNIGDILYFMK